MRKKFTESRTYEEAYTVAQQRIDDAVKLYDEYKHDMDKYFIKRPCPFCGEESYTEEVPFQNRYGVARCKKCNSLYVNPCPTQEVLNDYYNNYECNTMLEAVYKKRADKEKSAILDGRIETIISYIHKVNRDTIKILEIGCSNGSFLAKLKRRVNELQIQKTIEYIGVDTNENAIRESVDTELNLVAATIESYLETTQEKFDIIWNSELVEHLIDPFSVFEKLYHVINQGGYMIFTTPNDASIEMKNLSYNVPRVLACNILPPMHLNAFSVQNVAHFVMRSGFSVVDISTPGKFDVEIFEMQKEYLDNPLLLEIENMTEEQKEYLQNIITISGGSSHLQCVVTKN